MNTLKEELIRVKKDNVDHDIFKNVIDVSCNFQDFMNYIEEAKKNNLHRSDAPGFHILNDVNRDAVNNIFNASDFRVQCAEAYGIERYGFSIVISENGNKDHNITGIPRHVDDGDTIHLHCVGHSVWTVWDKDDNPTDYETSPGDVVYIKAGTNHSVKSLSPRAGIVFVAC